MRSGSSPRPVSISTGTSEVWRSFFNTSKPSMPGSIKSRIKALNFWLKARARPSGPEWAISTSYPIGSR